ERDARLAAAGQSAQVDVDRVDVGPPGYVHRERADAGARAGGRQVERVGPVAEVGADVGAHVEADAAQVDRHAVGPVVAGDVDVKPHVVAQRGRRQAERVAAALQLRPDVDAGV